MGVAISELIPRKEIGLADLADQKIAVDAFNTIYYFLAVMAECRFPGQTDIKKVYDFYLNPPHTANGPLSWNPPKTDELLRFLVTDHDFSKERAERAVQRLRASFEEAASPLLAGNGLAQETAS